MLNIPLIDVAMGFSSAIDLISPQVTDHQKRVSYIAYSISTKMKLSREEKRQILLAGFLHDCGAIHHEEKLKALQFDFGKTAAERHDHGIKGWKLLRGFEDLRTAAEIIRFHHLYWNERDSSFTENCSVPLGSHVIHLADRIDVLIDRNEEILNQRTSIENKIRENKGKLFMPEAAEAFFDLSSREYFWFDLMTPFIDDILRRFMRDEIITVSVEKLLSLAGIINKIIDFRSNFTAAHSIGVAECARALASKMKFSKADIQMMNAAGLLHDLGKLAIPIEILEKNGPLSLNEFNIMKRHVFYTHRILERIPQMETINEWASFHHEKLNGGGYPFGLEKKDLSPGSRIMAVCDIFTALTEPRPYRYPLSIADAIGIMDKMAKEQHLDGEILAILKKHIEEINQTKLNAQNNVLMRHRELISAGL